MLGMDWLASLGNVKANFKNLILTWEDKGEQKSMRGDPSLCKSQALWKAMVKALTNQGEGYGLSFQINMRSDSKETDPLNPGLEVLVKWNSLQTCENSREPVSMMTES